MTPYLLQATGFSSKFHGIPELKMPKNICGKTDVAGQIHREHLGGFERPPA
jgi:hypothetical protein